MTLHIYFGVFAVVMLANVGMAYWFNRVTHNIMATPVVFEEEGVCK